MNKYYTDEQNAQIVVALLKAHGIRKVVASPGTTNIPIAGSVQNDPFFEVYSAADERSAAYIACGIAHETGQPVVLSCTGATASRNYLPALTEAYYRKLPIIAITSTSSIMEVGHLLPQCIDRSVAPNDTARVRATLPVVKDGADAWDCEIKTTNAILECQRDGGGPVHLNLVTSYQGTFGSKELPPVRTIKRINRIADIPPVSAQTRVAIFLGSHKPYTSAESAALEAFVSTHNAVVLCDHTSAYKGKGRLLSALACTQGLSKRPVYNDLTPELIIHLGEVSGDYPTMGFLAGTQAPVWRVSEDGELRDKFRRLQTVFEMREADFFQHLLVGKTSTENKYLGSWKNYILELRANYPELPYSNTWIAKELSARFPQNSVLHFGILNSLRNWNYFEVDPSIQTASNVGGFGIDGCVSALIGASLANPKKLYFGVIGDLAFFYDLNSIGNRHLGKNLRLLLVNNGGGGEFKMSSHIGSRFEGRTDAYIAAAGHYGDKSPNLVRHIATDLGFRYISASSKEEFEKAQSEFLDPATTEKPILFECFTDFADESKALEIMESVDSSLSTRGIAVAAATKLLPSGTFTALKRALR